MTGIIIGLFIGTIFGVATMALCVASSEEPPAMINDAPEEMGTYEKTDL